MKKEKVMGWAAFIETVTILLFAIIPMVAFPKANEDVVTGVDSVISDSIGSIYLFMGLMTFRFAMYIVFGRYGSVTPGRASDESELSTLTQVAMLFCIGIGSNILYWGVIEWAFYYQVPPGGTKSMGDEALRYTA